MDTKNGLLTTTDNPFDPFTQWEEWLAFDRNNKYFTCEIIARLTDEKPNDDEDEKESKYNKAVQMLLDFSPNHLMVYPK